MRESKIFHRREPIPQVCRVGNIIATGSIAGIDPTTGEGSEDPEIQIQDAFKRIRHIVEVAGATLDDIVQMTVYLKRSEYRNILNREWVAMFPNPDARPARHTIIYDTPGTMVAQIEFLAVA